MSSSDRRLLLAGALTLASSALACCGFRLRGADTLSFRSIALTGFGPRSPLAQELKDTLQRSVVVQTFVLAEVALLAAAGIAALLLMCYGLWMYYKLLRGRELKGVPTPPVSILQGPEGSVPEGQAAKNPAAAPAAAHEAKAALQDG